jgi:hypothetical protein
VAGRLCSGVSRVRFTCLVNRIIELTKGELAGKKRKPPLQISRDQFIFLYSRNIRFRLYAKIVRLKLWLSTVIGLPLVPVQTAGSGVGSKKMRFRWSTITGATIVKWAEKDIRCCSASFGDEYWPRGNTRGALLFHACPKIGERR